MKPFRVFAVVDGQGPTVPFVSHIGTDWKNDPTRYDPAGEMFAGGPWPARMQLKFPTYHQATQYIRQRGCYVTARAFYVVRIV